MQGGATQWAGQSVQTLGSVHLLPSLTMHGQPASHRAFLNDAIIIATVY